MNGGVQFESLKIKKFTIKWLSLVTLKISNHDVVAAFRLVEKIQDKKIKLISHLSFNETCLINNLLPTYTNIYKYIYIYIYIYKIIYNISFF